MTTVDSRQAAIDGILRIFGDSLDTDALETIIESEGGALLPLRKQFSREINKLKASRLTLGRLLIENESILRDLKYRDGDWRHSVHHKYNFYLEKLFEMDKLAQQIYDTLPKDKVNGSINVSQPLQLPQKRVRRTKAEIAAARSAAQPPATTDKAASGTGSVEQRADLHDGNDIQGDASPKTKVRRSKQGSKVSE